MARKARKLGRRRQERAKGPSRFLSPLMFDNDVVTRMIKNEGYHHGAWFAIRKGLGVSPSQVFSSLTSPLLLAEYVGVPFRTLPKPELVVPRDIRDVTDVLDALVAKATRHFGHLEAVRAQELRAGQRYKTSTFEAGHSFLRSVRDNFLRRRGFELHIQEALALNSVFLAVERDVSDHDMRRRLHAGFVQMLYFAWLDRREPSMLRGLFQMQDLLRAVFGKKTGLSPALREALRVNREIQKEGELADLEMIQAAVMGRWDKSVLRDVVIVSCERPERWRKRLVAFKTLFKAMRSVVQTSLRKAQPGSSRPKLPYRPGRVVVLNAKDGTLRDVIHVRDLPLV